MTNLSADAPLRFKGEPKTEIFVLDTSVAQTVWKGAPLMIDDNGDTDHVIVSSSITVATSDAFVGIAAERKAVAASDPERAENAGIEVYVWPTIIGFKNAVLTNADLGKVISMSDTAVLYSGTSGAYPRIGKLFKVEDDYAYVELDTPWVQA